MATLAQTSGRLTVTIEGLGHRGEGWVRLEDGWLSVAGALPGETVTIDVAAGQRGRRIWGEVLDLVDNASPRRGPAHCERFPACRGCQVRHLTVAGELGYKADAVAECVERYANLARGEQPEIETIAVRGAIRPDAFRIRTHVTVRWVDRAWDVGLIAGDGLVDMTDCPALADTTRRAVTRFREALGTFAPPSDSELHHARIAAPVHGHGYVDVEVSEDRGFDPLLAALDARLPPGFGLAITDEHRVRRHVRGPQRIRLPMADLRLEVGFDDWFHATIDPAEVLYDAIMRWLDIEPGERVLDAGCGVGTIGLLCAAAADTRVVGFDVNPASIETAELNAIQNGLDVELFCAGWERAFRKLTMAGARFDTVVINPMSDPLGHRALAYLPRLGVQRVLYLGPSVAPAAKDIGILRELGYGVARLGAVNLHPATYHVMLAALLGK